MSLTKNKNNNNKKNQTNKQNKNKIEFLGPSQAGCAEPYAQWQTEAPYAPLTVYKIAVRKSSTENHSLIPHLF